MSAHRGLTDAIPMQCATTLKGATPAPATLATRAMDSAVQVNIKNPSVKHLLWETMMTLVAVKHICSDFTNQQWQFRGKESSLYQNNSGVLHHGVPS